MGGVQRIRSVDDLKTIVYEDGVAAVEAPAELLDALPLRNERRQPSPRLDRMLNAIRNHGYNAIDPVIARIGRKGRWVVLDGGHRITAARIVSREFWSNMFGPRVGNIYFLLFTTPASFSKVATLYGLSPEAAEAAVAEVEAEAAPAA